MDQGGAFGSPGATGDFNVKAFVSKPEVILRITGWVFSVVVFGCITDQGWTSSGCVYNENAGACNFGNAVGIIAFLALMAFLVSDAMFDNIANVMHRKYVVIADIAFSGVWTFMWFVCFCFLTDLWRRTNNEAALKHKSASEAAIAFSFFSLAVFAALTLFAIRRYRQGITTDFRSGYDPEIFGEGDRYRAPYSGPSDAYQTGAGDYRESPFAEPQTTDKSAVTGGYQAQGSY